MTKKIFFSFVTNQKSIGIVQATEKLYGNVNFFNKQPIFDFLQDNEPNVIFLNEGDYETNHIIYAKHEYPQVKFVLLKSSEEKIKNNPFDLVLHLNNKKDRWFIPYLVNENFTNGKTEEQYSTDILFITDQIEQSEITNKWISSLGEKYRLKAYGENKINNPYYLGRVLNQDYKNIFASTKLVLMLNDMWIYTSIVNNKIPIVFNKNKTEEFEFSDYSQLDQLCDDALSNFDTNLSKVKLKFDLSDKTYSNFTKKIFEELYK